MCSPTQIFSFSCSLWNRWGSCRNMIWLLSLLVFTITPVLFTGLFRPFKFHETTKKLLYPIIIVHNTCASNINKWTLTVTNNNIMNNKNQYNMDFQLQLHDTDLSSLETHSHGGGETVLHQVGAPSLQRAKSPFLLSQTAFKSLSSKFCFVFNVGVQGEKMNQAGVKN